MCHWRTYPLRSSNLDHVAIGRPQGCFPSHHAGAVREHGHADERVAIVVPANNGIILILGSRLLGVRFLRRLANSIFWER